MKLRAPRALDYCEHIREVGLVCTPPPIITEELIEEGLETNAQALAIADLYYEA
jgi:hypothetical protein